MSPQIGFPYVPDGVEMNLEQAMPETLLQPCTKCGRPLGVVSYFTAGGHYHYECIPDPLVQPMQSVATPASLVEPDGLVEQLQGHSCGCGGSCGQQTPAYIRAAAAALTQLRQRVTELERITDRLDADLATSDGHREAAEAALAAVERERDEALTKTYTRAAAEITLDIEAGYAASVREVEALTDALAASEAKVLQLSDTLALHMDILQRCANARHDADAKVLSLTTTLLKIASPSTVAGLHEQDRAGQLQAIARAALEQASSLRKALQMTVSDAMLDRALAEHARWVGGSDSHPKSEWSVLREEPKDTYTCQSVHTKRRERDDRLERDAMRAALEAALDAQGTPPPEGR